MNRRSLLSSIACLLAAPLAALLPKRVAAGEDDYPEFHARNMLSGVARNEGYPRLHGGTFTITFRGETTSAIKDYNPSPEQIEALRRMRSV